MQLGAIDTVLKTKTLALWEMAQTLPANKQWMPRMVKAIQ
jgi:hypothetical protein